MQVKVVIGTIAFMLTMIVLGYSALREPSRLEDFTGAAAGRSIETGAAIFANNCAACHGVQGKAEVDCINPVTGDDSCVGLPLQSFFLLCGQPSKRLLDLGWEGTTQQYLVRTISAGRTGTLMPAWLSEFGGPMRPDQINNAANYVLNWGNEDFCDEPPSEFSWADTAVEFQELPEIEEGNPELGAVAYQSYGCAACHGQPEEPGSANIGPWLGEIKNEGANRIEGYLAQDYIYESILDPNAFIAPDCPNGPCNEPSLMPGDFSFRMSNNPQDMADILAYLMGDSYQYP